MGRRIAGTGSLGVGRFVVLVEGKGSPDGNYLLDIKEAKPSAMTPRLTGLESRAGLVGRSKPGSHRTETNAGRGPRLPSSGKAQRTPLHPEGLQPSEDRVSIGEWGKKLDAQRSCSHHGANLGLGSTSRFRAIWIGQRR